MKHRASKLMTTGVLILVLSLGIGIWVIRSTAPVEIKVYADSNSPYKARLMIEPGCQNILESALLILLRRDDCPVHVYVDIELGDRLAHRLTLSCAAPNTPELYRETEILWENYGHKVLIKPAVGMGMITQLTLEYLTE